MKIVFYRLFDHPFEGPPVPLGTVLHRAYAPDDKSAPECELLDPETGEFRFDETLYGNIMGHSSYTGLDEISPSEAQGLADLVKKGFDIYPPGYKGK